MKQYEKDIEWVDVGIPNLWEHYKDVVLRAFDDVAKRREVKEIYGGEIRR